MDKTPESIVKEANKEVYRRYGSEGLVSVSSVLTLVDGQHIKRLANVTDQTAAALTAGQEPVTPGKFTDEQSRLRTLMKATYELGSLVYSGDIAVQNNGQDFSWSLELGNTVSYFDPVSEDTRAISLNISKDMIRPLSDQKDLTTLSAPAATSKDKAPKITDEKLSQARTVSLTNQARRLAEGIFQGFSNEGALQVFVTLGVVPHDPNIRMIPVADVRLDSIEHPRPTDSGIIKIETEKEINQAMLLLLIAAAGDLANFAGSGQIQIPEQDREDFTVILSAGWSVGRTMEYANFTGYLSYTKPQIAR